MCQGLSKLPKNRDKLIPPLVRILIIVILNPLRNWVDFPIPMIWKSWEFRRISTYYMNHDPTSACHIKKIPGNFAHGPFVGNGGENHDL